MYNTNNYGYNPYGTYIPQRPITQQDAFNSVQQRSILNGKQVDSIESAKIIEYSLDGTTSYFPLTDGSAIVTKQLQNDGTSKITVFKPITEAKDENRYITQDDMRKAISEIDLSDIEDIKDELRELKQDFKDFKKNKKKDD